MSRGRGGNIDVAEDDLPDLPCGPPRKGCPSDEGRTERTKTTQGPNENVPADQSLVCAASRSVLVFPGPRSALRVRRAIFRYKFLE